MELRVQFKWVRGKRVAKHTEWNPWLRGLISVVVSGASAAVVTYQFDPEHFNFGHFIFSIGVPTVIGLANFLAQSPLPKEVDDKE